MLLRSKRDIEQRPVTCPTVEAIWSTNGAEKRKRNLSVCLARPLLAHRQNNECISLIKATVACGRHQSMLICSIRCSTNYAWFTLSRWQTFHRAGKLYCRPKGCSPLDQFASVHPVRWLLWNAHDRLATSPGWCSIGVTQWDGHLAEVAPCWAMCAC